MSSKFKLHNAVTSYGFCGDTMHVDFIFYKFNKSIKYMLKYVDIIG